MTSHSETWENVLTLSQVTKVKVQTIMEHLAHIEGLTVQQMLVLFSVHNHTVSTVGDVSKKFLLQQANISALTKKLEVEGLLMRERNQVDVRVVNLSLTAAGEKKVKCLLTVIEEMYRKISTDNSVTFNVEEVKRGFHALSEMVDYFYEDAFREDVLHSLKSKK